jgi:hypothetical protein
MNAEIQKQVDNLVKQSMSFAKAVRNEAIEKWPAPVLKAAEEVFSERPSAPRIMFAPMIWPDYGRNEIDQRVANFKAHQQKMTREREEFFVRTMARALKPSKGRI